MEARKILASVRGRPLTYSVRIEKSLELAKELVLAAHQVTTHEEKKREKWLSRMVDDPKGKAFLTLMTDRCFRSHSPRRTTDALLYLLEIFSIPQFLYPIEQLKLLLFKYFGKSFPDFFVPLIKAQLRKEMSHVLLPDNEEKKRRYLKENRRKGIRINLNHLGEAILGEEEAKRRLGVYLADLKHSEIDYVSVKVSTLFSQLNLIGWDHSLDVLSERLRLLYRTAGDKFVNLDMEEYRDFALTLTLFQKVLSEPEFLKYKAGIVLQSYLPESFLALQKLTTWAMERVSKGGATIKVRLVKGANLAMEKVESAIKGWPQATYEKKIETDANFKRLIHFAVQNDHTSAVEIGVGSHNLFDLAYALIVRSECQKEEKITFEMLEGMAEPMQRVVHSLSGSMLLYCPEAEKKDFHTAVAYLIRRLDENTGEENFLRHFFELYPHNEAWKEQENRFTKSCKDVNGFSPSPRRTQNRNHAPAPPSREAPFQNEPDTDFSLEENRLWAFDILRTWEKKKFPNIPVVIAASEMHGKLAEGFDPSRPETPIYHYSLATFEQIERALQCAKKEGQKWKELPFQARSQILGKSAQRFREQRHDLIGAMITDGGKTIWEADPEVSEAVDFLEYYRKHWETFLSFADLQFSPKGTFLVAPPWNFPCSIPVSGIAAALTAGNCVIFKPAPEAVLVGWTLVQLFWEAGVPKEALQFINCDEESVGSRLIQHPSLDGVILTGGTATALKFLKLRPGLDLHAETGGKNAIIATAMCDRDLAVRDIVRSAFSHSGQKCSACSLAILEAELYDDPNFLRQLKDAAESLFVGSAWHPAATITPLIRPPEGALKKGLSQLDEGETWLVKPKNHGNNPHLWSPGIKLGVKKGSFTHQTELFGPILGVMRAETLADAIDLANDTPYGLTSGLHSLDEREQAFWKERIVAGNLYINRGITGAIVRRQPFGGCKASSFGPGAKAGGPNYVLHLTRHEQIDLPIEKSALPPSLVPLMRALALHSFAKSELDLLKRSFESYANWAKILKEPSDPSGILGQRNEFFHVSLGRVRLWTTHEQLLSLFQVAGACLTVRTSLEISAPFPLPQLQNILGVNVTTENEEEFLHRLSRERIRVLGSLSEKFLQKAAEIGATIEAEPVLANGRVELLHYLREVAVSTDTHRYGYLPPSSPCPTFASETSNTKIGSGTHADSGTKSS